MENIKNAIGEKIYDVIGKRLVNEEEITNLYEELLRVPKEKWEAKIKRIDGIIEEKKRILSQINELLLGYRLDRTKLEDMKKNIQNVVPFVPMLNNRAQAVQVLVHGFVL